MLLALLPAHPTVTAGWSASDDALVSNWLRYTSDGQRRTDDGVARATPYNHRAVGCGDAWGDRLRRAIAAPSGPWAGVSAVTCARQYLRTHHHLSERETSTGAPTLLTCSTNDAGRSCSGPDDKAHCAGLHRSCASAESSWPSTRRSRDVAAAGQRSDFGQVANYRTFPTCCRRRMQSLDRRHRNAGQMHRVRSDNRASPAKALRIATSSQPTWRCRAH